MQRCEQYRMDMRTFHLDDTIYTDIKDLLFPDEWEIIKTRKKISYYNISCGFDIETSSFYYDTEKAAIMYEWTFGINGRVVIGRTWESFLELLDTVSEVLQLDENKRLICYVHNLGFEFAFLCQRLDWIDVFAVKERRPVKAVCTKWIEFKCSNMLSGYSLAALGNQLTKYKINKKEGDLDYSLIRHSETPLTHDELMYCVYDVLVVMAYVQEKIENDGDITKIPLTKTGYVRRAIKKNCLYPIDKKKDKFKYLKYRELMRGLTLNQDEYEQLKRGFQGGFTHASCMYVNKVIDSVGSFDFSSSYPAVILSERFPMSSPERYSPKDMKDFRKNLNLYCCIFDIELDGVCASNFIEHPISSSRCFDVHGAIYDNGRIVKADHLITTWTEQDFFICEDFYTWERMKIYNFRRFYKGYLPTDFIRTVLSFYGDKTKLKGVEGREVDYLKGKELLNSCYGAMVTDIFKPKQVYEDGSWRVEPIDMDEALEKYNAANGRALYYPWGVWVTAYARRNLFTGIKAFGNDYIYSDTDSIKAKNIDNHMDYINSYNKLIKYKLERAMYHHKFDFELCQPETIKGVKKLIGVWDFEGISDKFKTLGAKRYLTYKHGEYHLTVAGLNKRAAVPYMESQGNVFDFFNNEMYIPPDYTGKNTHTYIDIARHGLVTDYLGKTIEFHELSGIHLEPCDFTLSLTRQYLEFLLGIKEEEPFN